MGISAGQLAAAAGCNAIHLFSSSVAAGICPGGAGGRGGGPFVAAMVEIKTSLDSISAMCLL